MQDQTVEFVHMADGTREDYQLLRTISEVNPIPVAENILGLLTDLGGHAGGFKVDRLEHSLQVATRAMRDGADEEMICVALLHDIGDMHAPQNHSGFAAEVLKPYISDGNYWLVKHHGLFQGYYYYHHFDRDRNARDKYRGHPMFEATTEFCEKWDQTSFDPDYDTAPLDEFVPMVHRLVANGRSCYD